MSNTLFDLKGKTALITGGNGGIGLGIAEGFAESGANLAIAARNTEKTQEVVTKFNGKNTPTIGIEVDVSDLASVENMVADTLKAYGSIDILVNNAGIGIRNLPQEYDIEDWNKVIDINLTGAFLSSKAVYPSMKKQGAGKIINIGSMTSIFGLDWAVAYASSKGGIVQLTKTLAVSWAKDGIQANTILPGWIHTDLTQGIKDNYKNRYDHILSRIPENRWGEPADLSGTAIFLASDASNYVTGVSIPVDGGYTSF
ncbi:MAG TPA: 2-deoxy-D-gluconate 3-dehydrogenase [Dehalococcoidia bacterium]|nr:2-deoxy-D-gluconate 3-dehydrogenase [Chloroflexota bacterium]HCE75980.1 2-deoxy-D-gluconate 3-dehydrogenase [Dehalococcoidia bacterium]|tara:strand:+ start:2802 stop:3569 length:768 start_codon:yes stop_codon:yes gene_type:complete